VPAIAKIFPCHCPGRDADAGGFTDIHVVDGITGGDLTINSKRIAVIARKP
jgi:hypothetical protein